MKTSMFIASLFLSLALSCSRGTSSDKHETSKVSISSLKGDVPVVAAAKTFLASLSEVEKQTAFFPFSVDERVNWNFVPLKRKGLTLQVMSESQIALAMDMLKSCLSEEGFQKADAIRGLELVLTEIEGRPANNDYRNPGLYYVAVFGEPSATEPWGWRFEGHHLSLNYTFSDKTLAVTPFFMGTNPAEIRSGKDKGKRVLAKEEDMGRALVKLLDQAQLGTALIAPQAFPEIITGNNRKAELERFEGLPYSEMTTSQQQSLIDLIQLYLGNVKQEVARKYWEGVQASGLENLYFAWAGGLDKGEKHYYRIHGPSLIIEYDNTQNDGNHIHTACRDPRNDFGDDLLEQHYKQHKH
ncbi:MAG: DUF3500 domain-containing protein [Saprospiraceae bacterium]